MCIRDRYKIHWGSQPRTYSNTLDVGNVIQADVDIPAESYIAATAYDTDENESDYSEEIFHTLLDGEEYPGATNFVVSQVVVPQVESGGIPHGKGYDVMYQGSGRWLIIHDHLAPGDTVHLTINSD